MISEDRIDRLNDSGRARRNFVATNLTTTSDVKEILPANISVASSGDTPEATAETRSSKVQRLACQACGHEDAFFEGESADGRPHPKTIFKKKDGKEQDNYVIIFSGDDSFQGAIPRYYGHLDADLEMGEEPEDGDKYEKAQFIILENLLAEFTVPFVLDCKLGIRSYEEKECESKKGRGDLYKRLLKIGPEYLTEEERHQESITKHKWMSTRDAMSTLKSLGFRLDGIVGPNGLFVHADYFANIANPAVVVQELKRFLGHLSCSEAGEGAAPGNRADLELRRQLAALIQEKVFEVLDKCRNSPFVASHEFIGTSLLIVIEAAPPALQPVAKAAIIDFAKTSLVPDAITVTHMEPWQLGNHEDGLLLGLANCGAMWKEVEAEYASELKELQERQSSALSSGYGAQA